MSARPRVAALAALAMSASAMLALAAQDTTTATLVIHVPADAKLYFDGQLSTLTGENRIFSTPDLHAGKKYPYKIRAEIESNGQVLSQSKEVVFSPGDRVDVDLTNLQAKQPVVSEKASTPTANPSAESASIEQGWPKQITSGDSTVTIYQPQVESWEGNVLVGRAAVSVVNKASPEPTYGVVWVTSRTEVDKENRTVMLEDVEITKLSFPSAEGKAHELLPVIRDVFKKQETRAHSLDRLETCLAIVAAQKKTPDLPVKNDPPRIFYSASPAVLVLIDGAPALRKIPGSPLQRVINTRALLLFDEAATQFYLYVHDGWWSAATVDGPWKKVAQAPAGLAQAKDALANDGNIDLYNDAEAKDQKPVTAVFVSTGPAELVETSGKPDMRPIPDTNLLEADNSDNDIFLEPATQLYYVLVSGRWFRSMSLERGPWEFVPGDKLPADFAKIPEENPRGNALASVPGTPPAQESLIANSIPQTATIKTDEAKLSVAYDGEPKFEPIAATPMQYAVNTPTPVVQVADEGYYACDNGVWFQSAAPVGPWIVCVSVPPVIYSMPLSCPIYYVTHCRIYGWGTGYVRVGYTPGYFGSCPWGGVVVYGTGWYYRPWIGGAWFGRPWTYGFGVGFSYSNLGGWGFGFHTAGFYRPGPWWGPVNARYWHGGAYGFNRYSVSHANVYSRWGNTAVVRRSVAINRTAVVNRERVNLNAASAHLGANNVFATRSGTVMRQTTAGAWEQHVDRAWRPAPEINRGLEMQQRMNLESRARYMGNERTYFANPGRAPSFAGRRR